jgi:hypothetical protein
MLVLSHPIISADEAPLVPEPSEPGRAQRLGYAALRAHALLRAASALAATERLARLLSRSPKVCDGVVHLASEGRAGYFLDPAMRSIAADSRSWAERRARTTR